MTKLSSTARIALPAAAVAAALLLSGCLGPAYRRPDAPKEDAYKEMPPAASTTTWHPAAPNDAAPRGSWWALFGDPRLDDLEAKVLASNQGLKATEAQYREAVELVASDRASYFPQLTYDGGASRQRTLGGSNAHNYSNTFNAQGAATWEPDVWGQIGKTVDVAKESAQSSSALLENTKLILQAELATDYFSVEESDMEEGLLTSALDAYGKALQLTQVRFAAGIASQADVAQAQAQLDSARAAASEVALSRAKFEHAIAVLTGVPPSSFSLSTAAISGLPPAVPTALPGELLERRPDVASAERLVAASNSEIGLARTAFFPSITLVAAGGYESGSFAQWFDWPSRVWSLGASAAGTIFDFGKHEAQYRSAKDAYDASVANYRQTALGAFQEVEDDLAALSLLQEEGVHEDSAAKAAEESLKLEVDRYKSGIVSYLEVITTQNIALTNERAAAQVLGRRMAAAVDLIRAVGGGWDQSRMPYQKAPKAPKP